MIGPLVGVGCGVAVAIIFGIFSHHYGFYIIGAGIAAIALVVFTVRVTGATYATRRIGLRVGALAVVVVLTAGVIAVPWAVAEHARTAEPAWTGQLNLNQDEDLQTLTADGRLLLRDSASLRAIDLDSGQELWSETYGGSISAIYATSGGNVLVIRHKEAVLLGPDGEELWARRGEEMFWPYTGQARFDTEDEQPLWEAVAAQGGTVVIQRCAYDTEQDRCTFRGIDSEGEISFEFEAPHPGEYFIGTRDILGISKADLRVLPSFFLAGDDQLEDTLIMSADTGERMAHTGTPPASRHMYVDGDVVMQQARPPSQGSCRTTATDKDGTQLWQDEMPCLDYYTPEFVSGRVYTATDPDISNPVMTMMNIRTGESQEYPGLVPRPGGPLGPSYNPIGEEVLIKKQDGQLFGVDPDTAERVWQRDLPAGEDAKLRHEDGTLITIEAAESSNPFIDEDAFVVTVIDSHTGQTVTSLLMESGSSIWPVGAGQALTIQDGHFMLIGG